MDTRSKVLYLKPEFERAAKLQAIVFSTRSVGRRVWRGLRGLFVFTLAAAWQVARIGICAVLVLAEPFLRVMLCGVAFLGFFITILFGFMLDAPHFPKWGMLGVSVGALVLYWLYVGVMGLFMRLPSASHDSRY